MDRRNFLKSAMVSGMAVAALSVKQPGHVLAQKGTPPTKPVKPPKKDKRITPGARRAAAKQAQTLGLQPGMATAGMAMPNAGDVPHYFGPFANYANSPMPTGSVESITLVDGGSGYIAPQVTISDAYGTGSGASASFTVSNGVITGITLDQAGSGYTAPVVIIEDTAPSGSGAAATASADPTTGTIVNLALVNGGSGYTDPVTINLYDPTGMGAYAEAVVDPATGAVIAINLIDGGSGYTAPLVLFADSVVTGSGAAATAAIGGSLAGGIRKFIDSLPGLTAAAASNRGKYLPVAIPDTTTYPGCEYYEIELGQYSEQLHSELPPTTLRGYRQTNTADPTVNAFHYLGPIIVATRNTPVRIKFTNNLPNGSGGDLFLPVDTSVMGAGMGPQGMNASPMDYTQNRGTLHLHGGLVPWISDGTPHQWITPTGENTPYPKGVSVQYVPDMWFVNGAVVPNTVGKTTPPVAGATNDPGAGSMTFYYNNQQSARLMFYHDHSYGITRLNVYAGEAAGYLIVDDVEKDLINGTNKTGVNPGLAKVLPDVGIPLILQDKTFVDAATIMAQDPNWKWGTGAVDPMTGFRMPNTGDLWMPNVYMPAQNPYDLSGANPYGRWQYGPWFWPPTADITHGPVPNEYYDPVNAPWEPPMRPDVPNPSMGMEAFNDTPLVNGAAYPYLEVEPKAYRFRILNAANDRFFNLHFYVADPAVTTTDGRTNTEVKMVPAIKTAGFPAAWSTDGREGGVPDPAMRGPSWIQIGTEGGFLPAPVVIPPQPVNWNMNATAFNFGNVTDHSLLLGCAERADVLVDFSAYAGQTLILYNDAPAAFPALDPRYDYYTGDPDQMDTGGAPSTKAGYGPNTRTIMQIRVGTSVTTPFRADLAALKAVFARTGTKKSVFEVSQDKIIVPQAGYNSAYNATFPSDTRAYVQLYDTFKTFTPIGTTKAVTIPFEEKSAHDEMGAAYDTEYGRMGGMLGLELTNTSNLTQNIILYGFASPPVEVLRDSITPLGTATDGTQIWKITHNGVDTHPVHFHLFNVQLINRVAWDGVLLPPDANELGWKETVRMNPLESLIVAMRPVAPTQPFDIPNSIRLIDPTMPEGAVLGGPPGGFIDPKLNAVTMINHKVNYGWEYVWHCHILSHEEMDMMHSMAFATVKPPTGLIVTVNNKGALLTWIGALSATGYTVQRAADAAFTKNLVTWKLGNVTTYNDTTFKSSSLPYYYRVIANNVVGDTMVYPAPSVGFPTKTVSSTPVVYGPPSGASTLVSVTQLTSRSPVAVRWSYAPGGDQTGFTIQRATDSAFTKNLTQFKAAATDTTYYDTSIKSRTTYYYRVLATNSLGNGNPSNNISIVTL